MLVSLKASEDQAQTAAKIGRNNQTMAEYAAVDAIRRGDLEAAGVRRQASSLQGAQRANIAARGLDVSTGTAAEIRDQVDFFAEGDQNTARFNAQRDAWSARASGQAAAAQGNAAARQANLQSFATVLGAGSQVADRWSMYSTKGTNRMGTRGGTRGGIGGSASDPWYG